MKKRFMCLLMVFMLCLCTAFSASAESLADDKQPGNVVTTSVTIPGTVKPMAVATAGVSGYISGGYGQKPCTLAKHITYGWIQATVSPSTATGMVVCGVRLPNGTYCSLGSVPASGGSTQMIPFYTMETGTYTFIFQPSTTEQLYISGTIFE